MIRRPLFVLALSLASVAAAQAGLDPHTPGRANLPLQHALPFTTTQIGTFDSPFAMNFLPDGRLLVTEKAGTLKVRAPNGSVANIAGVPAVAAGGQGGLLDVIAAPDFARSHHIYLTYAEGPDSDHSQLAMARGTLAGDRLEGVTVLWRSGSTGAGGQFGAVIAFAPDGQSLFLSSGERQRFLPAQDPNQAIGKILHLTLDGQPWPGNPGHGKLGAATIAVIDPPEDSIKARTAPARSEPARRPNLTPAETWSTGHRNPYGLQFAADGTLWEVEMGPQGGDELNVILPGRNYGWPLASNGTNYNGVDIPDHRPGDGFEVPRLWWNPSISPGGLMIYSGAMFPQWKGSAFIGGLSGKTLIRVALSGTTAKPADQWAAGMRVRDVVQAPDGAIWLLGDGPNAKLMRLTPKG